MNLLRSYLSNYIQEEIKAEATVRNIDSFSRALPHAISNSGKFIDYSKLAKQAKVSRHSLSRFYEADYEPSINLFGVHLGKKSLKVDGVWCHPWQVLLRELGL